MHLQQAYAALRFAPVIPLLWLWVLLALCVLALLPAVFRRARGALWRALAFAVLLLWLAGPRIVQETREMLPDIGVLLVDHTASMQVRDRARIAAAAQHTIETEAAKLPNLELRTVTVPPSAAGGTRLFGALGGALANVPRGRLAGVIAITDGQVHDIPAKPSAMLGSAPLHVLIPARGEETDRRLRVVEAPSYGIVGKPVQVRVAIDDLGVKHPDATARLTIRRDGEPPVVQDVPVGQEHTITVPITRAGPTVVELSAAALPGEVSTVNNRAVVEINGVRDRLRVLLVSGEPHQGERTWRRLLKSDPSVDLVHFTILRPPEKDDLTPLNELSLIAFPVRELFLDKIKQFDLIILDRFQNRGILPQIYLRNIADYVRNGGALLMSAGPEFASPASLAATPLGQILPASPMGLDSDTPDAAPLDTPAPGVIDGPFRPLLTSLGTRHPVTDDLPGWKADGQPAWGEWYRHIAVTDPHGETVMKAPDGQPLLILDRVGKGRVALLLSDQIWLWSRGHDGGGPQAELLRRTSHWLMKQPELEENALSARDRNAHLLIERRSTSAAPPPPVTITDPDGRKQQVTLTQTAPGRASADVPASAPGVWQVTDGTNTAYAAASVTDPLEMSDLRATATRLGPAVQESAGSTHWLVPDGAPALRQVEPKDTAAGAGWIGLRQNHAHLVTGIAALPLMPSWLALLLILGLAFIAWSREGT